MMTVLVITIVLGAWATLSVLGGEMQRQRQELEIVAHNEARRRKQPPSV